MSESRRRIGPLPRPAAEALVPGCHGFIAALVLSFVVTRDFMVDSACLYFFYCKRMSALTLQHHIFVMGRSNGTTAFVAPIGAAVYRLVPCGGILHPYADGVGHPLLRGDGRPRMLVRRLGRRRRRRGAGSGERRGVAALDVLARRGARILGRAALAGRVIGRKARLGRYGGRDLLRGLLSFCLAKASPERGMVSTLPRYFAPFSRHR